jgi:hypothetical protein
VKHLNSETRDVAGYLFRGHGGLSVLANACLFSDIEGRFENSTEWGWWSLR